MVATDMGWHLDFIFPWGATARIGSLVVATSALAGGLPAWRAARSNVSSAVVCE
jgi:ABC-type antimicrobial peptide transport system permease subunit